MEFRPLIITVSIIVLAHFFCVNAVHAQDIIKWSPTYKLQWKDFWGTPDTTMESVAVTSSGISCKSLFTDTSFTFTVFAFFDKGKSWKKEAVNVKILKHEQGHFDITEIFSRKLKIELGKIVPYRSSVQSTVNAAFENINQARDQMQDRYDKETDYGRNSIAQRRWSKFIRAELMNSL